MLVDSLVAILYPLTSVWDASCYISDTSSFGVPAAGSGPCRSNRPSESVKRLLPSCERRFLPGKV